jgi:hypothetical protein
MYVVAPRPPFSAFDRVAKTVYFRCSGDNAAGTTEKDSHFLAAASQKALAA